MPVVALCGGLEGRSEDLYKIGIHSIMPITRGVKDIEYAMKNADYLLEDASHRMFRLINIKRKM